MAGLDFLQAASNTASDAVAGPIDIVSWLMKKAGIPVGDAVGGTAWQEARGLRRPVAQSAEALAGETFGLLSPIGAAAKAPQIARGLLQAGDNLAAPRTLNPQTGAIVYHGSPHKFDRFDSSKIGTGEGAQAYGHGLYLAESPDVARTYSADRAYVGASMSGKPAVINYDDPAWIAQKTIDELGDPAKAVAHLQMVARTAAKHMTPESKAGVDGAISLLSSGSVGPKGNLYKVDLPDDAIARMLDWDKPLSQQAPDVVDAVSRAFPGTHVGGRFVDPMRSGKTGRALLDELAAIANKRGSPGARAAEPAMRAAGIPGIRYLDGGSRGAGTGTSNFVVFPGEEDILKILERNGQPLGLLGN